MNITTDKILEAKEILIKGKDQCFSEADYEWAINVLREAFNNGYDIIKVY